MTRFLLLIAFCLSFLSLTSIQTDTEDKRDRRAELDIDGRISEVSISPDGRIWLAGNQGYFYFTEDINSLWHADSSLKNNLADENGYSFGQPGVDRIAFFDNDIAIATGYITSDPSVQYGPKDGYYLTTDGGKSWVPKKFGSPQWIYDTYILNGKYAWMGGSDGNILFSDDLGQSFKTLNTPYNGSSRMHSIHMISENVGISGALHNYIYQTENNWKSFKKLRTPLDQKAYKSVDYDGDDRIEKIRIWNDYYVIDQNGHIFYTKTDDIKWKKFPEKLIDFDLDERNNVIFGIGKDMKVLKFTEPQTFKEVGDLTGKRFNHCKAANGKFYVLLSDYSVAEFSEGVKKISVPYTEDEPIPEPRIVVEGENLWWGASWKDHLYISDDKGQTWFREKKLDINVRELKLLNDSTVLIWTGDRYSYSYSLKDHSYSVFVPKNPFGDFFDYNIKKFEIISYSSGCFHYTKDNVTYLFDGDTALVKEKMPVEVIEDEDEITKAWREGMGSEFEEYYGILSEKKVRDLLFNIDRDPMYLPSIEDFNISKSDIEAFNNNVKQRKKDHDDWRGPFYEEVYYSIPTRLKDIDSTTLDLAINDPEGIRSTTSNHFYVNIMNSNKDSIVFQNHYYHSNFAWNLPWTIEIDGVYFKCYSLEFSKFVKSALPDDFLGSGNFSNEVLLMDLGNYFAKLKKEEARE